MWRLWPGRLLSLGLLAAALSACLPPRANFQWGLGTTEIVGTVEAGRLAPRGSPPLVVVYRHHYKFVELDEAPAITHPSIAVVPVTREGRFRVPMPSDVVAVDLLFIAPDRLTDEFRFRRQIGMGRISYDAVLRVMPRWRDHFYTYLQPQLAHLIVEGRYHMSAQDQQVLGDWLGRETARLEAAPGAPESARPRPAP